MRRKKGFTLLECLIALIIMALITTLVSLQIRVIKSATVRSSAQPLDWYVCLTELESADHQFILERVEQQKLWLTSQRSGLTYELHATDRLYLSRENHGGYMLLFDDIKPGSVLFSELTGSRVVVKAERKNGQPILGVVKFYEKTNCQNEGGLCNIN